MDRYADQLARELLRRPLTEAQAAHGRHAPARGMTQDEADALVRAAGEKRPMRYALTDDLEQGPAVAWGLDCESLYLWYQRIGINQLGSERHAAYVAGQLRTRVAT